MIKLIDILKEAESILVPRRSKEDRSKNYDSAIQRKIQQYIKNGSKGDLDLDHMRITSLPNNLTKVGGDLDLAFSEIESLPNNLKVRGDLILSYTKIESLPNGLEVGGSLYLHFTNLKSLPQGLKVKFNLTLNGILLDKYTDEQIRQMCPGIKGKIQR